MAAVDEQSRLDRLLQRYGNDVDVVWLVEQVQPRHSRIQRRDDAIRTALPHFPGPPTMQARALANALLTYWEGPKWRAEKNLVVLPEGVSIRYVLLHQILRASGKPLGWQTIYNICKE